MFGGEPQTTPLDLHWRMFGIDVRVHPFFWLTSAMLGWPWFQSGGVLYLLLWVLCVFVSVLIHELGHVVMARLFGSYGHIMLYAFGGLAFNVGNVRHRWQRILVSFAGPLAQFLLLGGLIFAGIVLVLVRGALPTKMPEMTLVDVVFWMLVLINLIWPIFNLLPIIPLDGGQISREVFEGLLGHRGLIISIGLSFGLAVVLAINSVWPIIPIPILSGGMYMAIFFALMAVTSFQLLQQELNRSRWQDDGDRLPWE